LKNSIGYWSGVDKMLLRGIPVMFRRLISITSFSLVAGSLAPMFPAAADTVPTEFIRTLGNQALEVIRDNSFLHQKQVYFQQLFRQDFDLPGISRFVLGPYWRVASELERQEFQQLFEDYLIRTYGPQLAGYQGQALSVTGDRLDPNGVIVTSQIIRPHGAPPIEIDWRLSVCNGVYKISDIVIAGVSLAVTQRSEFAQVIQRNGGQVESLLSMMREKIATKS
jgi:phospholipid transport system substrate-binding protein